MGGRCWAVLLALCPLALVPTAADAAGSKAELAYAHARSLYALRADGSGRRVLVSAGHDRGVNLGEPAWSPDGRTLAFVRSVSRGELHFSQIMLLRDGRVHTFTRLRRTVSDSDPAWSPDGQKLAFARFAAHGDDLTNTLRVARRDGSGAHEVSIPRDAEAEEINGEPTWLPGGDFLAYTRTVFHRGHYDSSVYRVRENGGGRVRLFRHAASARWARNGSIVAFAGTRDRNGETCSSDDCGYNPELYVARGDGTGPRRVSHTTASEEDPSPSPDGRRILFSSDRSYPEGDGREVYSVGGDGSCLTWLTNGAPDSSMPAWLPAAAGDAAPGACGPANRRPLVDTTVPRRARSWFWLGSDYRGLLLSSVDGYGFSYEDCEHFDPGRCWPTVEVATEPVCDRGFTSAALGEVRIHRRRGALVGLGAGNGYAEVYTGRRRVVIASHGPRRGRQARLLAIVRRVVPYRGHAKPGSRLARPVVPRGTAARLREARRAVTRSGSIRGAARALHTARSVVIARLRLTRALRRLGPIHTTRCPRPRE